MISEGFVGGGESSSAKKAHLRSIRSGETLEVQAVSKFPRLDTTITFSNSDKEGCQHPHDDPLVIKVVVANKTIHRVLVDNGSSANIIFASTFNKMSIGREKLEPVNACLCGFSGERVLPLGSIQLVLTLGDPPCQATTAVRYFQLQNGVGMVRGNQHIARECYSTSMKQKTVDNIYMDELDMRDEVSTRPVPSEELEPVQLGDQPEHLVYIGSKLAEDIKSPLIRFLKQNMEVFAWKQEDMGGIDLTVITHMLNVINPN